MSKQVQCAVQKARDIRQ